MRISCSLCTTRFEVGRDEIGKTGRLVRCGSCKNVWLQVIPVGAEKDEEVPESTATAPEVVIPEALVAQAEALDSATATAADADPGLSSADGKFAVASAQTPPSAPPAVPRSKAWVGWVALVSILGALVIGVWIGYEQILANMQAEAEQAGVQTVERPPGEGLSLTIGFDVRLDAGKSWLVVQGEVINVSGVDRDVPPLRGKVTDSEGSTLTTWDFDPPVKRLRAGEGASFESRVQSPRGAANLSVAFYKPE